MTETSRADSHDNDDGSCRHGRLSRHASPLPPRGAPLRPAAARARAPRRRRAVGSALRPRLRPANSPSAACVRGRRAMADARGEPVRPYLPTLQLHLHAHAVPALSCHTTPLIATPTLYTPARFVLCSEVGIPL